MVLILFQTNFSIFTKVNGYIVIFCLFSYGAFYELQVANLLTQNVYTIYDMTYYDKENFAYLGMTNLSNVVLAIIAVSSSFVDLAYW